MSRRSQPETHKGLLVGHALGGRTFFVWVPRDPDPEVIAMAESLLECQPLDSPKAIDALQRYNDRRRCDYPPPALGLGDDGSGAFAPGRPDLYGMFATTKGPVNRVAKRVTRKKRGSS